MSKRIATSRGVIQREKRDERAGSGSAIAASSSTSRTPAARCAASPSPSCGVDRAAREHPGAAHEALRRVALDEQHLEPLRPPRSTITVAACRGVSGSPVVELVARLEAQ